MTGDTPKLTRISISFRSLLFHCHFHVDSSQSLLRPERWAEGNIHLDLKLGWPGKQKKLFHRIKNRPWPGCRALLVPRGRCGCGVWLLQLCLSHEIWVDWATVVGSACRPSAGCRFCDGKRGRARRHQHQLALIRRPGLAGLQPRHVGILMPTECWDTAVTTELTSGVGRGRGLGNYKCLICPMSRYIILLKTVAIMLSSHLHKDRGSTIGYMAFD